MLFDQHVHSSCSNDAGASMKDMALAAIKLGLNYLCFTDHCDLEYYETGVYDPDCIDIDKLNREFLLAKDACDNKITLSLGLELGGGGHMPDKAAKILDSIKLDFVIGSIHNLNGQPDFYMYGKEKFINEKECLNILGQYIREHYDLLERSDFDVLGHIGYPLRYMLREGLDMDLREFKGELERLFKLLGENGKGIEVNTAGLRNNYGKFLPSPELLALYRQTGGEIITIGSDAHDTMSIGSGIPEAEALLRELGFKYFTVFKDRKPEYIKL